MLPCLKCRHQNSILQPFCNECGNRLGNLGLRQELAEMDVKLGKIKEAIQQFKDLAEEYISVEKYEDVKNIIKNLVRIAPDDVDSYRIMGDMHFKQGAFDHAEKYYRDVLKREISNVIALIKLGETLSKKGDQASAIIAYRKVIKIDPNAPEPYEFLVEIDSVKENKKEATGFYDKLVEIYSKRGNQEKVQKYSELSSELSGKKNTSKFIPAKEEPAETDDDTPPPEDMEVIGLHLPAIELSFSEDEVDPFAPSLASPNPSRVSPKKTPEVKEKKEPYIDQIPDKIDMYIYIVREHEDYNKRYLAISNLKPSDGEKVIEVLVEALKDQNRTVRTQAAITLGKTGDKRALYVLMEGLEKDEDPAIRESCASIMGDLMDPRAIDLLIKALKDKDKFVCGAALKGLTKFNEPRIMDAIIEYSESCDTSQWPEIVQFLSTKGDKKIVKHLYKIFDKTTDIDLKVNIIAILAEESYRESSTVDLLIGTLRDSNNKLKLSAIKALGDMGDKKAIKHLCDYLTEKDQDICRTADEALTKLGYKKTAFTKLKAIFFKKY
ncbi:MAG: HEAT repeat domain-containing protein [Candidatus Eremiobacterota bacterium]